MEKNVNDLIELVKAGAPKVAEQAVRIRFTNNIITGTICLVGAVSLIVICVWLFRYAYKCKGYNDPGPCIVASFTTFFLALMTAAVSVSSFLDAYYVSCFPDYYMVLETVKLGHKLLGS